MSQVGVGIIGLGFAGRAHLDAVRRIPGARVVALADENHDLVRDVARSYGVRRQYSDYRDLVADPNVHVVHDCAPNFLHFEINQAVLLAGKACYSEKPLTLRSDEAGVLVAMAEERGIPAAVNFNYRAFSQAQEARALIASGALGEVYAVHGSYLQDWLLHREDWNWRLDTTRGGPSRAVADIGSHWMDLAQHLAGLAIVRVSADLSTVLPERLAPDAALETFAKAGTAATSAVSVASEDAAGVLFRFGNGAPGTFYVSQVSAGRKSRLWIEVDCADGALAWESEDPERLWLGFRGQPNRVAVRDPGQATVSGMLPLAAGHSEGWLDALRTAIGGFYGVIAGESHPWVAGFGDGQSAVRLTEAILESNRTGGWVTSNLS